MGLDKLMTLLGALDLGAVAVFAVTGALVASRKQMDIVGFIWLGVVTGVGGGTIRDLLLGVPVFWINDPTPVIVCVITAIAVYFSAHLIQSRYRLVLWLDALGLALFTIAGAAKGLDSGAGPIVAAAMGLLTGTAGGVIRDLLGQEPSIILRREIYVTASLGGAATYVVLMEFDANRIAAAGLGFGIVLIVRGFAIAFGWSLPTYRARPGRDYDGVDPVK